jgi:CRP-like cAMP-binding protein
LQGAALTKQTGHTTPDPRSNFLLAKLKPSDYQALLARGKVVALKLGKRLYYQDDAVDAVYFPLTCMVCLLVNSSYKKPRLELATVSREGVVGATETLHSHGALGFHIIQIPGYAVRIPAAGFLAEVSARPEAEKLFGLHLYALTRQILQGAVCNHVHSMEQRCARWLLVTQDAAEKDTFPITQEFLSHMLGVRRATVNEAVGMLRTAGLITYVRGKMTVLERAGLESAACVCYETVKRVYLATTRNRDK